MWSNCVSLRSVAVLQARKPMIHPAALVVVIGGMPLFSCLCWLISHIIQIALACLTWQNIIWQSPLGGIIYILRYVFWGRNRQTVLTRCLKSLLEHHLMAPVSLFPAVGFSRMLCCLRPWTTTTRSGRRDRSFPALSSPTS